MAADVSALRAAHEETERKYQTMLTVSVMMMDVFDVTHFFS